MTSCKWYLTFCKNWPKTIKNVILNLNFSSLRKALFKIHKNFTEKVFLFKLNLLKGLTKYLKTALKDFPKSQNFIISGRRVLKACFQLLQSWAREARN